MGRGARVGAVALKVLGPVHKSEGGGVRLGLMGHDAVVAAYDAMSGNLVRG